MGLKLRFNVFHGTTAEAVYGAYISFYAERGRPIQPTGDDSRSIEFHEENNGWVAVALDSGWEWKERREAQLFVSQRLWCHGFLVFVYDGNYWGYELFDCGKVLDQFVQESAAQKAWFPGKDCRGKPEVVAQQLPYLRVEDVTAYLVQKHDWAIPEGMNTRARPGDEFFRFEECAVLDFLRMLGIRVQLQDGYVQVQSPMYRTAFKVSLQESRRTNRSH